MVTLIQQAVKRPLIVMPLGLAAGVLTAALIIFLLALPLVEGGSSTMRTSPAPAQLGGRGGSGNLPPKLLAAFNSLPLYPGAVSENGPVAKPESAEGRDVWETYFVQDAPEQVGAFYDQALPTQGWRAEGPPVVQAGDKGDTETTTRSFAKSNLQVTISITANTKDPSQGATQLSVAVVLRGENAAP